MGDKEERSCHSMLGEGEATLKNKFVPVQWVAIIVASREAAKSFFSNIFFSLYRNDGKNDGEK